MAEPPRILLDVNVVLDALQSRAPFSGDAVRVLACAESSALDGVLAADTVTTLFYLMARHSSPIAARVQIGDLLSILDVAAVDRAVLQAALALPAADFEDCVQMAAAPVGRRLRGDARPGGLRRRLRAHSRRRSRCRRGRLRSAASLKDRPTCAGRRPHARCAGAGRRSASVRSAPRPALPYLVTVNLLGALVPPGVTILILTLPYTAFFGTLQTMLVELHDVYFVAFLAPNLT